MNTIYRSTDLGLSTYLRISGAEFKGIIPLNSKQVAFSFKDSPQLKSLINTYFTDKANVNPALFLSEIRRLKTMVASIYRNKGI